MCPARSEPGQPGDQHLEDRLSGPGRLAPEIDVGLGQQLDGPGRTIGSPAPRGGQRLPGRISAPPLGNAEQGGGVGLVGRAGAIQLEDGRHMPVKDGQDHQRVAITGPEEPVEGGERCLGVAAVDCVGEVPRRNGAGLAKERLELRHTDLGAFAVGGNEGLDQRRQTAHVLAQVLSQPRTHRGLEAQGGPL